MKKLVYTISAIALLAFATSCKKDYTCKCTTATGETKDEWKVSKKQAEDDCTAKENTLRQGGDATADCKLDED